MAGSEVIRFHGEPARHGRGAVRRRIVPLASGFRRGVVRGNPLPCPTDVNDDGKFNLDGIFDVLAQWGPWE